MADQSKIGIDQVESVDDLFAYLEGKLESLEFRRDRHGRGNVGLDLTKETELIFPHSLLSDPENPILRDERLERLIKKPNCSSLVKLCLFDFRRYVQDDHSKQMIGYSVTLEDGDYREWQSEFGFKVAGFFAPAPELEEKWLPYWSFKIKRERRLNELTREYNGEGIESMDVEYQDYSNYPQSLVSVCTSSYSTAPKPDASEGVIWLLKQLKARPEGSIL